MWKFTKNIIKISLASVFLQCVLAHCASAQTIDLSTDKAVLMQLGKLKNKKFSKNQVCIKRLKESAKIIVIGFSNADSGCEFGGAFVNTVYFENSAALSKNALAALGWKTADRQEREEMAELWVSNGLFAFSRLSNQMFGAVSTDDDGIKVIVSLKYPPGVRVRSAPKIFLFDKNGGLVSANDY